MMTARVKPRTDRGGDVPSIRQVSVFTENRVGALAQLLGTFDETKVTVLALNVIQGVDCAIVRFVFNDTDVAAKMLVDHDYHFTVCDLVAVELGPEQNGLSAITKALLEVEIDLHYAYGLILTPARFPAIVLHVDNPALAVTVLGERGFYLLDEADLRRQGPGSGSGSGPKHPRPGQN